MTSKKREYEQQPPLEAHHFEIEVDGVVDNNNKKHHTKCYQTKRACFNFFLLLIHLLCAALIFHILEYETDMKNIEKICDDLEDITEILNQPPPPKNLHIYNNNKDGVTESKKNPKPSDKEGGGGKNSAGTTTGGKNNPDGGKKGGGGGGGSNGGKKARRRRLFQYKKDDKKKEIYKDYYYEKTPQKLTLQEQQEKERMGYLRLAKTDQILISKYISPPKKNSHNFNIIGSIFFAFTISTTIGYG